MTAFREKRRVAAGILAAFSCIWLGMQGVKANDLRLSERQGLDQFTQDAQTLMAEVPQEEREHFMAYRVEPKWYVAAKALPCMRFYFLQEILAQADPAVMEEIVAAFESDPPHWLVIYYNRRLNRRMTHAWRKFLKRSTSLWMPRDSISSCG